jgi:hypothetical protein
MPPRAPTVCVKDGCSSDATRKGRCREHQTTGRGVVERDPPPFTGEGWGGTPDPEGVRNRTG